LSILEQKTFISQIAPFDRLRSSELEAVAEAMDIAYFKQDEVLMSSTKPSEHLYIIIKGIVQEVSSEDGVVSAFVSQDTFDAMSLIEGNISNEFVAQEELICYLLPKEIFTTLINNNQDFHAFYYQNMTQRLNELIEQRNSKELSSFMVAKIGEAYLHPPSFVDASDTIYRAVEVLKEQRATSVLVKRGDEVGIITDTDIREYVVLQRRSVDSPVGDMATYNLISMTTDDFLFNALLRMTKHNIKRLVIYEAQDIVGVLDQMDLLSFFSNHSHLIMVQVDRANNLEQLQKASENIVNMIQALYAKGVKIRYITQLVNELNAKIFTKLYSFVAPPKLVENSCLVIMGSEGRGEQVLKTDQDNAIILRDDAEFPELENITEVFTETLLDFGYPRCPGNIMVSNPYWCNSLKAMKAKLYDWVDQPTEENLMNLAIFYDAEAVGGDNTLLTQAKEYLFGVLQDNQAFTSLFAKPTLSFETPLGFFTSFIVEKSKHKNELDIKKGGIFPIVHGVRSLALEYRLTKTNTIERIKALQEAGVFEKKFSTELIESLAFLMALRLQAGLDEIKQGKAHDNYINPSQLSKLERDLLKDAFKVVNEFKKFITYHFKLNMV